MIKTLLREVKEFKKTIDPDPFLHDPGSSDGDDHTVSDGFHY